MNITEQLTEARSWVAPTPVFFCERCSHLEDDHAVDGDCLGAKCPCPEFILLEG